MERRVKAINNISISSIIYVSIGFAFSFILSQILNKINLQFYMSPFIFLTAALSVFLDYKLKPPKPLISNLVYGIIIFFAFLQLRNIYSSFTEIQPWDFPSIYLYAKTGHTGNNFYSPDLFKQIYNSIGIIPYTDEYLVPAVIKVGFIYPPPTMLLFYPLGWFDFETGYVVWQSLITLFFILDIYLLIKIIWEESIFRNLKPEITALLILIIFLFPGLTFTIALSQTNTLLLFLVLMTVRFKNTYISGISLPLMILIKPFAVIFMIYFIVIRKWKLIFISFLTGMAILMITGLVFNFDIFIDYFSSLPSSRLPEFVFSEPINNSLNAVILRVNASHGDFLSPQQIKLLVGSISSVLLLVTLWNTKRLQKINNRLALLSYIPLSLIVYPGTLAHYNIILLPLIIYSLAELNAYLSKFWLLIGASILVMSSISLFQLNFTLIIILLVLPNIDHLKSYIPGLNRVKLD
ncbi:glycosyltransferase family 87 protein [Saccharicrinis sp. FJH62]|uniref:glycosyltransferase family 87 protein n=1 Tax=Saccharicrinis sp. FJH62 TaxID=3344657 RepID=UPI0035D45981